MRESQKIEDTVARNVRKVPNRYVFPVIRGSGRSKSRLAKASGCGDMWLEQMLYAAVARSTLPSQNVKDHFLKLGGRKIARRNSTCTKHRMPGPLLEVRTT